MNGWISAIALLATLTSFGQAQTNRPLNVLWICGDDHAPYVCGAYGNKLVRTPNLDRLASEGIRFDRAYCNSPVCTASRQSFLTGKYPRTLGVTLLKTPLPEGTPTLARFLKAKDYDTAAIGKMHFNSTLSHGFDVRIDMPQWRQKLQRDGKKPLPEGVPVQPAWRPFRDPARVWLNAEARAYPAVDDDMADTFLAREAVKYLQARKDKPFFLMVSFYAPHSPFNFPTEFHGRHKPESFSVYKVGPEDDWQIPKIFRDLTPKEKQGIQSAYYTATEYLDRNVGLVLDALKKSGKDRDTLVIYLGDHGYMLGQHGRFEKHCFYEPAVRSTLLMRLPGTIPAKSSTEALVEFVDIVPTVLELTESKIPEGIQGRSLVKVLKGQSKEHRPHVISEYSENEEAMIRTERYKLIYCTGKRQRDDGYATGKPLPGRTVCLFDLHNDPDEMSNLARKPEQARRVENLTALLAEHMRRTARQPELLPKTDDVHKLLDFCLQPRDATANR